jgi:hypothetical protein
MEEGRRTRRTPLLAAFAGVILLAAVWATMAFAGGSTPAAKPAKAQSAKAQSSKAPASKAPSGYAGHAGGEDCPFGDEGASNDL